MAEARPPIPSPAGRTGVWTPVVEEPSHPLAALEGAPLAGGRLSVFLGRQSRFGARYFLLLLSDSDGALSEAPVLSGLHHSGPLPSYNWVEVAETNAEAPFPGGRVVTVSADEQQRLFRLLLDLLPPGGHLMVEYDSPQRAETARALALAVPPIATALGALLFRIGFGARFKDWQIAEGGSEGPRKLQAYKPVSEEHAHGARDDATATLRAFLESSTSETEVVAAARTRAAELLTELEP